MSSVQAQPIGSIIADPLVQQTSENTLNESVPLQSGSHPLVPAEDGKQTTEKNIIEEKLEHAFSKDKHDQEISGAGVGSHPKA